MNLYKGLQQELELCFHNNENNSNIINTKNELGMTLLMAAAKFKHHENVGEFFLSAKNIDLNVEDLNEMTALMHGVKEVNGPFCKLILKDKRLNLSRQEAIFLREQAAELNDVGRFEVVAALEDFIKKN